MSGSQPFYLCFFLLASAAPALQAQIVHEANLPLPPARYEDHGILVSEALAGDAEATFWLGAEYQDTGNPDLAAQFFTMAVAKGHPQAMHNLARLYEKGRGVSQDLRRAFELNLQAAKKGWSHSQYDVAMAYDKGTGVERDVEEARRWCEMSEKSGYGHASSMLGVWYRYGNGPIAKDCVKAAHKYMLAARHGHLKSAHQLGWMYYHGEGIERNFEKAEKWFRVGAYSGDPMCMKDLAQFLAMCPDSDYRRPTEALSLIQEALAAVQPDDNFKYHTVYGYALSHCMQFDAAIGEINTATQHAMGDPSLSETDRRNILEGLRNVRMVYGNQNRYLEELPAPTPNAPAVPDDDILENKAWPYVMRQEAVQIDGSKWAGRLKAALSDLPKVVAAQTIFELAAPAQFACFANAPKLPSQRSEVDALIQKAESGDSLAAFSLAALLLSEPKEKDKQDLGLELLQHLAGLNQPDACNLLGWMHLRNQWVAKDKLKALNLFLAAANQLHGDGQCSAAYGSLHGLDGAVDLTEGLRWYRRAALKDHMGAKVQLAERLVFGVGTDKNVEEGVVLLTDTASRGYAPAQLRLGWLHIMGKGVKKDQAKGFELFEKAAAQGEANALVEVGEVLRRRGAGAKAQHEAATMFLKAAQKLHFGGMRRLADSYLAGEGVMVDYPRAIAWLKTCALSGQLQDQARLALVLAACPEAGFRNSAEAVKVAAQAVKKLGIDECPEGPAVLQAAAAAYASAGEFSKAEDLETRAGKVIKTMLPEDTAAAFESARRLTKYRRQQPHVEPTPEPESGSQPLHEDTVLEDFDKLGQRMTSGD